MVTSWLIVVSAVALPAAPGERPKLTVRFELAVEKYAHLYPGTSKSALEAAVLNGVPGDEDSKGICQALQGAFPFVEFTDQDEESEIMISIRPDIEFPDPERAVRTHFHVRIAGPSVRGGAQEFSEWQFRDENHYQDPIRPEGAFLAEIVAMVSGYLGANGTRDRLVESCISHVELCAGGQHDPAKAEFVLPIRCQDFHIDEFESKFLVQALVERPTETAKDERIYRAKGNGRVHGGELDGNVRALVEQDSREEVRECTVEVLRSYISHYRQLKHCGIVPPSRSGLN